MIACESHQELRDMVIELRSVVKHIDVKISELVDVVHSNNNRVCALETYNNQEIGRSQGVTSTATFISVVVSVVISVVAVLVSAVFR